MAAPPSNMSGATTINLLQVIGGDPLAKMDPLKPGQVRGGVYMENSAMVPEFMGAQQAAWYGWLSEPPAQRGVGRLLVDALIKMPVSSSPTVVRPPLIQRSAYEQIAHYRVGFDMNYLSRQMGLRDDSNTNFESRVGAARLKTSGQIGAAGGGPIQPSGATSTPPIEHSLYMAAWRVPRFSTEPFTVIPQSTS
jgi:hypothetical protein